MSQYTLRIACSDEKGLVYKVTKILYQNQLNIEKNDEFVDAENNHFFMRTVFSGDVILQNIKEELLKILPENSHLELKEHHQKNVVILATKEHHCLSDLLVRNEYNDLDFNILAVIGNHDFLRPLVEKFGIPFHYISAENMSRESHEDLVNECLQQYNLDYLILAKYMRILTPEFIQDYNQKIINIHHSFLPAFIGANPYKQAYNRGVKIIGATAHFVTNDLDEGPIIYQDVIQVSHSKNAKEMAYAGKDVEKIVLAKALKLVFEERVFIFRNKTIIFE
ncbi:formyltetrahydrofolate deformylase [Halpernia humi]|uniref:Formyltetrahydrofolate deformylase n=1 Tax=Halpernia humi TaxID=493375 RepID=A0A1H5ZXT2_9FLAO|nr:formyltetrahydrofolate deformylase [Halpernia humi]SEG40970.1 formyltetrahydrofolate deformylase [Halpernia humi]